MILLVVLVVVALLFCCFVDLITVVADVGLTASDTASDTASLFYC